MKKVSTALLALTLFASSHAMAATKTATLIVSGTIAEVCTLTVNATVNATTLNLTTQQSGVKVGDISTQCNISSNGYSLSVATLNASELASPDGNTPVGYTINLVKTQGNAINSGAYFPSDSNSLDIPSILETSQQKADILLNTTSSTPFAGTYSDTVTFTLQTL
jgi:spore coat protein U-like protein